MKARRLERWLGIALALGMVALVLVLQVVQSGPPGVPGSVTARDSKGRRAALALLEELGFDARAWSQPPGALPAEPALVWLPAVPADLRWRDAGGPSGLGELHDPHGYLRHVLAGGVLVLPAKPCTEHFLVEDLGLDEFAGLGSVPEVACEVAAASQVRELPPGVARADEEQEIESGPRTVLLPGGGSAEVPWAVTDPFARLERPRRALVDEQGRTLAVRVGAGAGAVVVLGYDGFLDNAAIAEGDGALLFVRLVEELARGAPVYFDEYALGLWRPASTPELVLGPRLRLVTLHLLLLLALFVWRHAWAREFPRDPEELEVVSPLARARSAAALYERARRFDLLARDLRRGVLRQLARRMRVRQVRAGERAGGEPDEEALLDAVLARAGLAGEREAFAARVLGPVPRGREELAELASALAELERRAGALAPGARAERGPRAPGARLVKERRALSPAAPPG